MEAPKLESPVMKTASVVLVEDHTLVRQLLRAALGDVRQLRVVGEFSGVKDAIAGCLRLKPSLVLIDWMLDDGKGIEIVHATARALPGTRFLFISSLEKEHIVREAVEAGVHGFVMKRAATETLLEAIQAVVAGRSYYCPVSSRLLVEALRTAAAPAADALTAREREILRAIARSEPVKSVAGRLGLSPKTIHNQLDALKAKVGIRDMVGLARYAARHGLVEDL